MVIRESDWVPVTDPAELAELEWNYAHRRLIEEAVRRLGEARIVDASQRRAIVGQLLEGVRVGGWPER